MEIYDLKGGNYGINTCCGCNRNSIYRKFYIRNYKKEKKKGEIMNEKWQKFILQSLVLICITVMACLKILDSESISLVYGTIVGYAFATAKEAYIKKE